MKLPKPPPISTRSQVLRLQPGPLQQDRDARADRAGGQLQLAEVALGEHDRPAVGRLGRGGQQERHLPVVQDDPPGQVGRARRPGSWSGVCSRPCGVSSRWRSSSAATSIRPEPHSPTGGTLPITLIRRRPSTTTFSIAPVLPRMPQEIRAPSKAGPAAVEAAESFPSASSTISPLVPMSTSSVGPVGVGQAGGQDAGHRVAADESADHRHHVAAAARMDVQPQLGGRQRQARGRRPARTAPRPADWGRRRRATAASSCCRRRSAS